MNHPPAVPTRDRVSLPIRRARDRVFFGGMAVVFALLVFIAFGPTYYWRVFGEGVTHTTLGVRFTAMFHVHGAVFTAWVAVFLLQTLLIATHRTVIHRRLGYAGSVLAAGMVVLGVLVSIETARAGVAPAGADPVSFLIVPVLDMVLFGCFVAVAILQRRNADTHKRLMVVAYACLLVAVLTRIPLVAGLGPAAPVLGTFVPLVVGMLYDRLVHGRVHPVYVWGVAILLLSGVRVPFAKSGAWHAIAARLMT